MLTDNQCDLFDGTQRNLTENGAHRDLLISHDWVAGFFSAWLVSATMLLCCRPRANMTKWTWSYAAQPWMIPAAIVCSLTESIRCPRTRPWPASASAFSCAWLYTSGTRAMRNCGIYADRTRIRGTRLWWVPITILCFTRFWADMTRLTSSSGSWPRPEMVLRFSSFAFILFIRPPSPSGALCNQICISCSTSLFVVLNVGEFFRTAS